MLKISCYSSSLYGNERIARIWQRSVCIRGSAPQRGCRSIKQPIPQPPGNTAGGAELPLIEGRGEELQSSHQSEFCFVFSCRPMTELCWRGCLQVRDAYLYRSLSADAFYEVSAELPPRGRCGPAPPRPSCVAPPLRGRGPSRLLTGLEVGAGLPLGSCVLRPPRRCRARWLLIVLCGGCGRCLFASQPGAAGARAIAPPAGYGCPEQVMGCRGCSPYRSTGAARAVGSVPLAAPAGGSRAESGRVTRSLPPASRRLRPGFHGGGDTLRGGGGGAGQGTGRGRGGGPLLAGPFGDSE